MMRGMFAAISGLKNHQTLLDVVSNDIANVNTVGYKSSRATFADSLNQLQRGASGATAGVGGSNAAQVGLGVKLNSIDNMMSSGALQTTGNGLDVAIQGDGFFRVATATGTATPLVPDAGSIQYTRAGNFTTNASGYLVTQDGYYVTGRPSAGTTGTDQTIQIGAGGTDVSVGQDGQVTYVDNTGNRTSAGYISLATFPNSPGLERIGSNRWIQSANSGGETVGTPGNGTGFVTSGALEMSNVDLAQAFTSMITAQRGYQANSRAISTADQMLEELVNLKH
jgi:flagellar hook protein FlgE